MTYKYHSVMVIRPAVIYRHIKHVFRSEIPQGRAEIAIGRLTDHPPPTESHTNYGIFFTPQQNLISTGSMRVHIFCMSACLKI